MHVGYFGVVIPQQNYYQAYFIDDVVADIATEALAKLRADPTADSSQVIHPLGDNPLFLDLMDAIGMPVPNQLRLSETDQRLLGSLCAAVTAAALAHGKQMGIQPVTTSIAVPEPQMVLGIYGYAIKLLAQRSYFWLEGKQDTGGIRTEINMLHVSTPTEAREAIEALSVVRKIKRRLMNQHFGPRAPG